VKVIMAESSRYRGYDVLAKRHTLSWDDTTRSVIDRRLQTLVTPRFLDATLWDVADALCRRIIPRLGPEAVPLVALLDAKLFESHGAGFRVSDMPYMREAWRAGLASLDDEARATHEGLGFAALAPSAQDAMLSAMQTGRMPRDRWPDVEPQTFFLDGNRLDPWEAVESAVGQRITASRPDRDGR
jgi:hypothetical protein